MENLSGTIFTIPGSTNKISCRTETGVRETILEPNSKKSGLLCNESSEMVMGQDTETRSHMFREQLKPASPTSNSYSNKPGQKTQFERIIQRGFSNGLANRMTNISSEYTPESTPTFGLESENSGMEMSDEEAAVQGQIKPSTSSILEKNWQQMNERTKQYR